MHAQEERSQPLYEFNGEQSTCTCVYVKLLTPRVGSYMHTCTNNYIRVGGGGGGGSREGCEVNT